MKLALLQSHPGRTERGGLSVRCVASLLGVSRPAAYHKERQPSAEGLLAKELIDRIHTGNPAWGSRQIRSQLRHAGHKIGRRKVRRCMMEMGIHATCPKPSLSRKAHGAQVVPYLLRNVEITRPNQAWSVDITFIPMRHGFMYLTAVLDWHTRCVVGWELDDKLCTRSCIEACRRALMKGRPEIINSDQGCQFTSDEYKEFLRSEGIRQSMDGKSRWADNVLVERWFRTFKYEEMYLTEWASPKEARAAIGKYIEKYNNERCHSSVGGVPPAEAYLNRGARAA